MEVPGGVERRRHRRPLAVHAEGRRVAAHARARRVPGCVRRRPGGRKGGDLMIRPEIDRDDTVRDLLRQPRPEAVDAARVARVRRAVHAAWRDAADGTRIWKRRVAIAAAAVLVFSITPTLVNWLRDRGVPQATDSIASTLFATSEVVFQHNGPAR